MLRGAVMGYDPIMSWWSPTSGVRAVTAAALLSTACGASVTAVQLDAGAGDVPAASSTCARMVGGPAVIVSDPADQERFRLVDAIATPDGALVAWRERDPSGGPDQVRVRRVRDDGSTHPWSAPGRMSRGAVVTLPRDAELQFSMVWDEARDGVAMLAGGQTDRGACVFVSFRGDGSQLAQSVDLDSLGGFTLSGCGSLARTADGWSLLTAEVRALWGDQLVYLSDDGRLAGMPTRLPMTGWPSIGPMTRTAVSDGFVATWVEPERMSPANRIALHARRFDRRGTPLGDDVVLDHGGDAYLLPRVLETREGLLASWYGGLASLRPLRADVSPAGEVASHGVAPPRTTAAHADVRGDEVLVASASEGVTTREVRVDLGLTDGRGARRGEPLRLLPERALTRVDALRVLPTRRGALVVFGQAERVLAVPVDCLP